MNTMILTDTLLPTNLVKTLGAGKIGQNALFSRLKPTTLFK